MLCPSCRHKLSAMTTECPVCGIPLSREPLKKPLLFQTSKNKEAERHKTARNATQPILVHKKPAPSIGHQYTEMGHQHRTDRHTDSHSAERTVKLHHTGSQSSFWQLARMEILETVILLIINSLLAFVASWQLKMPALQAYSSFWHFLGLVHFLVSWAYFALPILLSGSSVAMLMVGLGIADAQPEKRLFFSVFMLLSVALVPLSFLCMVLTSSHATLAEILTGQEVRERVPGLLRR